MAVRLMMAGVNVLGALLEGFDQAEARDFHGRWRAAVAAIDKLKVGETHKASRSFHVTRLAASGDRQYRVTMQSPRGDQRVYAATSSDAAHAALGRRPAANVNSSRERGAAEVDAHMQAFKRGEVSRPRVRGDGRSGPIAPSSPSSADRHGGFKVGDQVSHRTPSIVNGRVEGYGPPQHGEVAGLQRNGYVRIREPKFGTTVDVHHSNLQRAQSPSSPSVERQRQVAARAGQGSGPAVFSSGRPITAPQRKRLSSVVNDIHANASQDRSYMNALISGALRDSGHTMGMTPGWMDRLHTNHASQLIKDLERLARHGPGEMAREAQPLVLGALLEGR